MYDAIVVGARCAGAPTAMLLARQGYRVLLVDRTAFPSDIAMSTHLIWQAGMSDLQRWGLLPRIQELNCPPISTFHVDFGPFTLSGAPPAADGGAHRDRRRRSKLPRRPRCASAGAPCQTRPARDVFHLLERGSHGWPGAVFTGGPSRLWLAHQRRPQPHWRQLGDQRL